MNIRCDIFCTVVDNLGDAGVCWRLARQLASEHGWSIRLWIDDLAPLGLLRPGIDPLQDCQAADGVEVRRWRAPFPAVDPAPIVIEAFACELPASYVVAMAAQPPVWINLEYLSAENWVAGCHGMASPHPTLPLVKYFFFPGFVAGTGGLLRERDADFGGTAPQDGFSVSLFCYDNPALPRLLDAWAADANPVRCLVAAGLPRRQVESWLGTGFPVGSEAQRGALSLHALPFLPQRDYDRLLGSCQLNFVRGEDSFVRAQWAQRPFVWQIYPQPDDAHAAKLDAFLRLFVARLEPAAEKSTRDFCLAWNGKGDIATAWPALRATLPVLTAHAGPWATHLAAQGDLAGNLARFCLDRI